jgi:nitric oxide reductase NorQ protein
MSKRIVRTPGGISVPEPQYRLLMRNVKRGKHTLIVGPTGSGKTRLAIEIAVICGLPVEVFQFSMLFDSESSLVGTVRLRDGETRFSRSRFVEAVTTPGCVIVLDEINRAPAVAMNALMSLADFQGTIAVDLDDGPHQVVKRAAGVVLVATANVGPEYAHTEAIDRALLNRFLVLRLDFPDDEQALVVERGMQPADAAWLIRIATEIRKANDRGQLSATVSTRGLLEVVELVQEDFTMEDAFESATGACDDASAAVIRGIVKATR